MKIDSRNDIDRLNKKIMQDFTRLKKRVYYLRKTNAKQRAKELIGKVVDLWNE